MTINVKAETQILLGLITLFSIGVVASLWLKAPPVITAICASLMVTACLYRFLGLFNYASMPANRVIKFTDPLEPGKEADLYPPYPFWIRADNFRDNYNGYSIMDMETDTAIATGLHLSPVDQVVVVFAYR